MTRAGYLDAKGRRLSFEWALIDGVTTAGVMPLNDQSWPAPSPPTSPHPAQSDRLPDPGHAARGVRHSASALDRGVNATVRQNRGTAIDAACVSCVPRRPD